jgi:hypothetical protein
MATVAFWYQTGQPKRFTSLPPLAQRVLPNLDVIVEGKAILPTAKHSAGAFDLQKGYDWTGDGQILFMPAGDQPVLVVSFQVEKEEYRGLVLRCTSAEDYGTYRIFLDGKDVQQQTDSSATPVVQGFDFYSKELSVKDYYLGSYRLTRGNHVLRFEGIGRNPLSKGNYLGFDSVRLRERWEKKRKNLQ